MNRLSAAEAATPTQTGSPDNFSGTVRQRLLHQSETPPVRVFMVTFEDGARTHWHSHAGGQLLHVLEGEGRHQLRGGAVEELAAGDIISVESGEEHWHGAADGSSMRHLAVSAGATRWLEPA